MGKWLKGKEYNQLTRVLVPDDDSNIDNTNWKPIVEAKELYEVLTKEGQTHYHQATTTPLVKGPFANSIGPFDDNEYCDAIFQGTLNTTGLATISEVHDIVSGMQYPDPTQPTPQFDSNISNKEFFQTVFKTRERTSSSPSGRHYGHYRTLLRAPDLLGCIASIANFCF